MSAPAEDDIKPKGGRVNADDFIFFDMLNAEKIRQKKFLVVEVHTAHRIKHRTCLDSLLYKKGISQTIG